VRGPVATVNERPVSFSVGRIPALGKGPTEQTFWESLGLTPHGPILGMDPPRHNYASTSERRPRGDVAVPRGI